MGQNGKPGWVLGLMSGTSLDGIDAALVQTDGEQVTGMGAWLSQPYDSSLREAVRALLGGAGDGPALAAAERRLTEAHAELVMRLIRDADMAPDQVDLVGFHGHTIWHRPDERSTRQIGDGALLARLTGIDVVADFRSADVAAGGQGAPLVPLYHAALARALGAAALPLAILNLGGVGNVTWLGAHGEILAFDTGPGNALLDDWVRRHTGDLFDAGGAIARRGIVQAKTLAALLDNSWFNLSPPKSLDRNDFSLVPLDGLDLANGAATLTAFTAHAAAAALQHFPGRPQRWLVTGGGRHNPALMQALRDVLQTSVEPVEAIGWRGDALEAEAFAFLARRSRLGLPLSLPTTTGVPRPLSGGRLFTAPR